MEDIDLAPGAAQVVVIGNNIVGNRQPVCPGGLRCHNAARLAFVFCITRQQALELSVFIAIHNQNAVHELPNRRFDEQRHDNYLIWAACRFGLSGGLRTNSRMQNRFELFSPGRVRKHELAH